MISRRLRRALGILLCASTLAGCAPSDPIRAGTPQAAPGIRASRVFAGPNEYPPASTQYYAFGILAFRSAPNARTRYRFSAICEAFMAALNHRDALDVPPTRQMVTVWPIRTDAKAAELNRTLHKGQCTEALLHYGILEAQQAIRDAEATGRRLEGEGPFLLAWSPAEKKGDVDTYVLAADMSGFDDPKAIADILQVWVRDIERDPSLWKRGAFDREGVRIKLRRLSDKYGPMLLEAFT